MGVLDDYKYQQRMAASAGQGARGATGALTPTTQNTAYRGPSPSTYRVGSVPSAPAPSSGGGGGGGGGSAPAPAKERYWWTPDWRDSQYNTQLASINRALADYETNLQLQGERYGTDYTKGLRQLGFRPSADAKPAVDIFALPGMTDTGATAADALSTLRSSIAPTIASQVADAGATQGAWDYEGEYDPYSAAAKGTRTSRDEFAGRGTLRSSDFAKNYADFQNRLQEQMNAMETGRTRYFEDAAIELAKQRNTAEEQRQQARVNAMARAAAAGEYRPR